ncbi:MAG: hypothetical protein V4857_14155 [Pseudomonadota bacterium]
MEIVLIKQTDARLTDDDAAVMRRFLFEHLAGATPKDSRAWNRFCRALNEGAAGEYFTIKVQRAREGWFHRKHMGMVSSVFKAQERVADFDQFRLWLKVGSGFVTWMAGPSGGVFPVPKSISFEQCGEDEMRDFHEGVVKFLRTEHAQKYLWPSITPQLAEMGLESILNRYERTPQ